MVRTSATDRPQRGRDDGPRTQDPLSHRRRTLGLCAHCHEPVELDSEHVRLYRLAWHVECALAARPSVPDRPPH